MQQRHVLFTGHVQGVGFRYTTERLARDHAVTGYVRNLDDGRVELVAEGPAAEIDALLAEVRRHFAGHIRSETEEKLPPSGWRQGFEILR